MKKIEQHVALVTGGSNGIGKAIAQKFASEKIKVIVADIVPAEYDDEYITYHHCDVSNADDTDSLFAFTNDNFGIPDIIVINAGKGIHEKLTEGDPEKWAQIININVMGALRTIRAFVPLLLERKSGCVVFISSVAADRPYTYGGAYSASKAALDRIAETLWLETHPYLNITIVSAGITDTDFFKNLGWGQNTAPSIGMGALLPEDIAEDVWYAVSKRKGTAVNKIITRPSGQCF